MMEIRARSQKESDRFQKLNSNNLQITTDNTLTDSIIMIKTPEGKLLEWTKGEKNVESFLKYGYVRIKKNCPYRMGKCICEKCSLYVIKNGTGDCAHVWSALK